MFDECQETIRKRVIELKMIKDMKKDYYKIFQNAETLIEIREIISQISYLEGKIIEKKTKFSIRKLL